MLVLPLDKKKVKAKHFFTVGGVGIYPNLCGRASIAPRLLVFSFFCPSCLRCFARWIQCDSKQTISIYPRLRNPGNSSSLREYPGYSSTSWEYTVFLEYPGYSCFRGRTLFRSVFNYLRGNHHLRIPTEWRGTIPDRLGWWNPDEFEVVLMIFDSFFPFFSGKNGKWKIATGKPCRSREIPHANPWKKGIHRRIHLLTIIPRVLDYENGILWEYPTCAEPMLYPWKTRADTCKSIGFFMGWHGFKLVNFCLFFFHPRTSPDRSEV